MRYDLDKYNLNELLKKEWIITNNIGGYASSTISSINTRKYHGNLISSKLKSGGRTLELIKVDEAISIKYVKKNVKSDIQKEETKKIELFSNITNEYMSTGYKYLKSVTTYFNLIIFEYEIDIENLKILIKKNMLMRKNENAILYKYDINLSSKTNENSDFKIDIEEIEFNIVPIQTYRNFHFIGANKDKEYIKNSIKFYFENLECENFEKDFLDLTYIKEEERGFEYKENAYIFKKFYLRKNLNNLENIKQSKNICIYLIAKDYAEKEENKEEIAEIVNSAITSDILTYDEILNKNTKRFKNKFTDYEILKFTDLELSFRKHIIQRGKYKSLIAGYHWFLDWFRDSLISIDGLLEIYEFETSKSIIELALSTKKDGLIANGFNEDASINYNSADASLLLINAMYRYYLKTEDIEFIYSNLYNIEDILKSYISGIYIDNNDIFMDEDFLISAGNKNTQNTWMDAKVNNIPVTARNGKQVEINALFYNAINIYLKFLNMYLNKKDNKEYNKEGNKEENKENYKEKIKYFENILNNMKENFIKKFVVKNENGRYLKDVVNDESIRPNQLYALSLDFPIVDDILLIEDILDVVDKNLQTYYALKTLSNRDKRYVGKYFGKEEERDGSYHQGIGWPYLTYFYFNAVQNYCNLVKKEGKDIKKLETIKENIKIYSNILKNEICNNPLEQSFNSVSEIIDSIYPYNCDGCISQAWSLAAFIYILSKIGE